MNLPRWLNKRFNLGGKPESEKAEHRELISDTYKTVDKVQELRENILESRDFPIASFLRGESSPTVVNRRVRK